MDEVNHEAKYRTSAVTGVKEYESCCDPPRRSWRRINNPETRHNQDSRSFLTPKTKVTGRKYQEVAGKLNTDDESIR